MKRNFIYSKKSVRTLLLKLEPYFLSHAERGKSFQYQDFLGGIHLCRHFVPTPFRLPIPIFNFGGGERIRTSDTFQYTRFPSERTRPLCDASVSYIYTPQRGKLKACSYLYFRWYIYNTLTNSRRGVLRGLF